MAICDVDFFKAYNDAYGHQAGDDALRRVAATLSAQTRDSDGVYRYGGEEFLLILPEQTLALAVTVMERIRRAVQDLGIPHGAGGAGSVVMLSSGVAAFVPGGRRVTGEQLLKEADEALYAAKSGGRNAVVAVDAL